MTTLHRHFRRPLAASAFILLAMGYGDSLGQETPPAPASPRSVRIPKPHETTLANGLRVIVVEDSDMPLVSARLLIRSGAEVDPPNLSGLADLTAELLAKGTATLTAPEIARAIESLGGVLESTASWDSSNVNINVMSSRFAPALEIMADVVLRPAFQHDEIERLRQQFLDSIAIELREPGSVAAHIGARVVFGGAPYGHPLSGTPESIRRIRRDDIVGLHRKNYRPDNAILLIGGDIRAEAAFDSAKRLFAGWEKPAEAASLPTEPSGRKPQRRIVVVDMPDAGQAAVVMAHPALRRTDREYFAAIVTNSVLGGGYSARLNQEIRIKRGLSYGAGSSLEARRNVGPFFASTQTKNESAAEVAALMLEELRRLGSEPVPDSELTTRKAVLIGNFGRSLETTDGLVSRIASLALYDLDLNGINTYIQDVQAIIPADVQKFASSRLSAAHSSIVVVGNAKLFLESLKKHSSSVDVIPIDELDLNRPSLRRPGKV